MAGNARPSSERWAVSSRMMRRLYRARVYGGASGAASVRVSTAGGGGGGGVVNLAPCEGVEARGGVGVYVSDI